jgi:hypothetical protein
MKIYEDDETEIHQQMLGNTETNIWDLDEKCLKHTS